MADVRLTQATTQPTPLDEIDLYPPELYGSGDAHAAWRTLRAQAPVWRQETPDGVPFWSVTRHHDVVDVLRDVRTFSSEYSTMLTVLGEGDTARGKAIHLIDPPRHGDVRGPTIPALSIRTMREHEPRIRERVRSLVADHVRRGTFDFTALATALPMVVAGEVMGIPEDQWAETARWTVASMAPDDPAYSTGDPRSTLMQAHVYLLMLFSDLIYQRRREPGQDLVSVLTGIEIDGRPATDDEVLVNCYAFIMGANPTVPQAASQLALLIAEDPLLWKRVRHDPSLVPAVVEETLRWASPVHHLLRRTTAQVTLGGQVIPAGGLVAAWVASANRDEEVFPDPFVFDPARRPNPHVAFGVGEHRCIGNSTATVGLRLLTEELAAQVASIEVVGEVRHLRSNFLNGVTALPVAVQPAGAG
jgi:cytochrome P450